MGCMAYLLVGTGLFCLVAALPQFNLWFAALGAVFIYIGWRLINEKRQAAHKKDGYALNSMQPSACLACHRIKHVFIYLLFL